MLERLRDQAALQLHRYRTGELTLPPARARGASAGSACCRRPRPATSSSTWRAIRSSTRPAGSSSCSACSGASPTGRPTYRPSGRTTATASAARSRSSSTSSSSAARAYPDMHVYHYAAYEPSTLARLMGTHATREAEIDELLRGEVFVDLLQVVRQGLRAGVESYSLKDVEKLFFTRTAEVSSGNEAVIEFERWLDDRRRGAPRRRSPPTTRRTASRRSSCATGCSRSAREAEREYGVAIPFLPPPEGAAAGRARRGAGRDRPAPRRAARDGGRRRRPRAAARGCSTTTAARRARAGGGTSAGCEMTDEELVDDGEALGGLEHDGDEPSISRS